MIELDLFGNITMKSFMNNGAAKGEMSIKNWFAQKSIFAFGNAPLDIVSNNVEYDNSWALDQCLEELTRNYEKQLLTASADYLIFDALGSLIPVREITYHNITTKVTWNNHMAKICNSLAREGGLNIKDHNEVLEKRDIIDGTKDFCEALLKVYNQKQIIIHMASYPTYYLQDGVKQKYSDDEIESCRHNNGILKLIYDVFKEQIPDAYYIRMPSSASSVSRDKQLTYCDEYMKYLVLSILMYLKPTVAQSMLKEIYDRNQINN